MCRSSRFLCFLSLCFVPALVLGPTFAEAGGLSVRMGAPFAARPFAARPFAARPFMGAPRAIVRPGVFPAIRPGIRPGVVGTLRNGPGRLGRFRRFGRGFGYGGFDVAGLGLSIAGDLAAPPLPDDGYGPEPRPSFPLAAAPPPCIRPLIIKVGHGLRHPARTRVIYGARPPCGF